MRYRCRVEVEMVIEANSQSHAIDKSYEIVDEAMTKGAPWACEGGFVVNTTEAEEAPWTPA